MSCTVGALVAAIKAPLLEPFLSAAEIFFFFCFLKAFQKPADALLHAMWRGSQCREGAHVQGEYRI